MERPSVWLFQSFFSTLISIEEQPLRDSRTRVLGRATERDICWLHLTAQVFLYNAPYWVVASLTLRTHIFNIRARYQLHVTMRSSSSSQQFRTPNGTDIHFQSSANASGQLVILLHGLGGSTATFDSLIPRFPQTYRVVAVDIEGFGKSPLNQSVPLSFPRYVSDIHHLVTYLQGQLDHPSGPASGSAASSKILLVGHSLGGIISLHYASTYPSEVAGALILAVGRSVRGIPAAQQRMRDLATTARQQGMDAVGEIAIKSNFPADRESEESQKEQVRAAVAQCDAEAYALTSEVVASDDHFDPDYSTIVCPCIFVAGDGDLISPVQRSKDVSGLVGGRSEVIVVKSGHQMILQDLPGVERALDKLLSI